MGCCSSRSIANGSYEPSSFACSVAVKQKTDYKKASLEPVYTGQAKILVVCTDDGQLKMANGKVFSSGMHPVETFVPMMHLQQAGFSFQFATVSGGAVVIETWAMPNKDEAVCKFYEEIKPLMDAPMKVADVPVTLAGYAAIFVPGGHGAMVNLPECAAFGTLLHAAHERGMPTIALCHGPSALLAAAKVEGKAFPYKEYKIVCFSDATDKKSPGIGYMPGHLQWYMGEGLGAQGVIILNKKETGQVNVDRELITGDSPAAANKLGEVAAPIVRDWAKAQGL